MLDWHLYQICYTLEIKMLSLLLFCKVNLIKCQNVLV